ncbi:photosystem reaction center subunit H [Synechococcales cyanobacterium C]|uniref:Photosystem reaction center subunit H n=1 Tax=Petrachloros mirabilis ULC683 TaxID=2781853 RepID=A0A8K1ZVK7_9CYAN|nr:PRC-barrel domain-containing protein [Petrachloros mirabilis]NCJ06015.1 photosystem reaction center subunit H [Petrachloros mirabilis ULC683]
MALSEQIQQRSDLIGTQVITRNTGKKLGVVNQLWVDVDQRDVVALGVRSTLITGDQRYMFLESVRQVGDVILVDDESAIEEINVLNYSTLINSEVVTETGELLGKVRGFQFDAASGQISSLIIASIGLPLIPAQIISTYELPIEEIVSSGPDRLIVFEGAEERLNQLSVGVMERLGLGAPPWEDEEDSYIPPLTSTSNQLGSGLRTPNYAPNQQAAPANEAWEEEEWVEARPQQVYRPPAEPIYENQWAEEEARPVFKAQEMVPPEEPTEDVWADDYQPQELKIPERQKIAEYEREPDY